MCRFPDGRACAVIDTAALQHNFTLLDARAKKHAVGGRPPRTIAVVKANAYGHGLALVVPALLAVGCSFFAVATAAEAISVRELAPSADVLILGYTPPREAPRLARLGLTQTVFSSDYAKELGKYAQAGKEKLQVHLKIEGGMCRLGFSPDSIGEIVAAASVPSLHATGIYTHFPCADCNKNATRAAFLRFLTCKGALNDLGLSLFAHAAASAALLEVPETVLDGVRIGLALYGISPTDDDHGLRPVMSLTAPVVQIHEVPVGTPVGYGGTFVTARPSRIGTLPIGYADGIPRRMRSDAPRVRIKTQKGAFFAPIAGNICMDQLMLDLTDTPAEVGDAVLFFENIKTCAAALGTIPYELFTGIGPRVVRIARNERNINS